MVKTASRMLRAISFGVRWRRAPSTIEIMRSRKASPGLAVTRTISQSDRTRVPPVTALLSPPLSRITGALSPVMALSSTEATPSMASPSPGIVSPASTSTMSSRRRADAGTRVSFDDRLGPLSLRADTSWRERRSVSAWALPRPSAIASAKLANSTVNHSQTAIVRMKPALWRAAAAAASAEAPP